MAQEILIAASRLKVAIEAIIASGGSDPREAEIVGRVIGVTMRLIEAE